MAPATGPVPTVDGDPPDPQEPFRGGFSDWNTVSGSQLRAKGVFSMWLRGVGLSRKVISNRRRDAPATDQNRGRKVGLAIPGSDGTDPLESGCASKGPDRSGYLNCAGGMGGSSLAIPPACPPSFSPSRKRCKEIPGNGTGELSLVFDISRKRQSGFRNRWMNHRPYDTTLKCNQTVICLKTTMTSCDCKGRVGVGPAGC